MWHFTGPILKLLPELAGLSGLLKPIQLPALVSLSGYVINFLVCGLAALIRSIDSSTR
jgi:hypothetical protein